MFYLFILKENNSTKYLLMKGFGESQQLAFASIKKIKIKRNEK